MMTTDLAVIGHISTEAVAAAALASKIYFLSLMFGMGLTAAVTSVAAEALGAHRLSVARRTVRMGFWAGLLVSMPIMALPLQGEQILIFLGQAPKLARLAHEYLFGVVWGLAPALLFLVIRSFMSAVSRSEPVFWITLVAIPANAL